MIFFIALESFIGNHDGKRSLSATRYQPKGQVASQPSVMGIDGIIHRIQPIAKNGRPPEAPFALPKQVCGVEKILKIGLNCAI